MDATELLNKELNDLGRAGDMLWFAIGEPTSIFSTIKKIYREVTEYAIHFQCQWRFVKYGEILLASHDIYTPFDSAIEDETWNWDIFDREKEKSSIFDVRILELKDRFLPLKIKSINQQNTGDLHIEFEGDIIFDTFITYSRKYEFYRFLDHITGVHTVVFDND